MQNTELPKTAKEARLLGVSRYFTGVPCKRGHTAERTTKSSECRECAKIKYKKHHYKNIENRNKSARQAHWKNREQRLAYKKQYRDAKKEAIRKKKAEWDKKNADHRAEYIQKNKESIRARMKIYTKNNIEKVKAIGRNRRARILGGGGKHTPEQIKDMLEKQKKKCINCKKSIAKKYHIDHIMPVAKGGSNDIKNIQLLCPPCNHKKNAKDPIKWAQENGRLL
jgi:5-methylcytosine-specific restriction endonuclease McrA